MANSADPDQLASSEDTSSVDLHCLQRQGIFGFSRTRVNLKYNKITLAYKRSIYIKAKIAL